MKELVYSRWVVSGRVGIGIWVVWLMFFYYYRYCCLLEEKSEGDWVIGFSEEEEGVGGILVVFVGWVRLVGWGGGGFLGEGSLGLREFLIKGFW